MSQLNFFFGLGIFLFGMSQLELGIRKLSDVRMKLWLRTSTGTPFGSVTTGVVTTAILQSSSMVSLLVLAFASAGLLPLANAIGIILGANLGTTLTGWMVAIFGFKLDLEAMALPLMGISAFTIAFTGKKSRIQYAALVALGIGLLLFGLGIMKTSMETIPERFDVSVIQGHHPVVYLLFGVLITVLVQSSSAVMMMALAAINSGLIALPEAVALVIGADLGTTSTTVLGSINGSHIKRQLALAHFSFNLIVDIAAFLLLLPLLPYLLAVLNIADPLLGLVAFHSVMNLLGLLAFIPFLNVFVRWIEELFAKRMPVRPSLLESVPVNVTDAALVAMVETVKSVALQAACNSLRAFSLHPQQLQAIDEAIKETAQSVENLDFEKGYKLLKQQEGDLIRYSLQMQKQPLEEEEVVELERLQTITRAVIYCNKTLKDIRQDLDELEHSTESEQLKLFELQRSYQQAVYSKLINFMLTGQSANYVREEIEELIKNNEAHYRKANSLVHSQADKISGESTFVSMQLNVNREIKLALENMLKAVNLLIIDQSYDEKAALQSTVRVGV